MIDFTEAFPNKKQFEQLDCEDEYRERFNFYVKLFNISMAVTVSIPALIESEIKKMEGRRDNILYSQQTRSPDGISLHPLFTQGWERAIYGSGGTVVNNCYKWCPEIKEQISAKYNEQDLPLNYFETLSKISMEEVVEGMACAKFYYWLKGNGKTTKENTPPQIETKPFKYDGVLMANIYGLCIEYKIFDFTLSEFTHCVEIANFNKTKITLQKKCRHLIFKLGPIMGKVWYNKTCKNYGMPLKRFGGLANELISDNWIDELTKILKNHIDS